jgi:hypothetical protein
MLVLLKPRQFRKTTYRCAECGLVSAVAASLCYPVEIRD